MGAYKSTTEQDGDDHYTGLLALLSYHTVFHDFQQYIETYPFIHAFLSFSFTNTFHPQILRVTPISASAKIRSGPPHDDRHDLKDEELRKKTWIGVLPASIQYGAPIESPDNRAGDVKGHEYIGSHVKEKNKIGEEGSTAAASE
jgi:hypothetical protein